MKRCIVLLISLYICCTTSAQFGVSYQFSTNSKIGVSYDFSNKLWANVGMYDGVYIEGFTVDAALMYNVVHKEAHDLYIGVGGIVNSFSGFILPIGIRFRPIKEFSNLSLQLEASPMYEIDTDSVIFFCSLGVRYTFGKK